MGTYQTYIGSKRALRLVHWARDIYRLKERI